MKPPHATPAPISPAPPPPPPPTTTTTPTAAPIPDTVLRAVHASDQAMYPVALPYTRLRAWVDACPDLSVCFLRAGDGDGDQGSSPAVGAAAVEGLAAPVVGVVVVLPLRRRCWEDLLGGRVKEADVEPGRAFVGEGFGDGEEEVGLHVYHVERFEVGGGGAEKKRFCEFALEEVMRRAQARRGWKVVGMSALTATPAGKRAFERLGFTPTGYTELFVRKTSQQTSQSDMGKGLLEMVCLYPGDSQTAQLSGAGDIVSVSEMTVNYNVRPGPA
ncbi:hypothetical protein F5144DRAFT_626785 [Chaetomium tenue]|uniref:Uncharacterized protein n=1 Tax=Chaetomium tenue TaxID=1854479 RepID=A0ACB7PFB8_9PEZI|nr:hypothetical protein F5144DRAFT_626785 [Chaetomium globosum]